MARGELLRRLFISHRRGNEQEFMSAALEVIAEEQRKHNHQLAKDLQGILENSGAPRSALQDGSAFLELPRDREHYLLLAEVRKPERYLSEILLGPRNRDLVLKVLEENRKAEILRTHGLEPSRKLLFCGPPGCGKTLCAEILSSELGQPLLYVRFDAVVSSYLGETASNLRKVFDYAAAGRWVVLFDEFDAIGKRRDDPNEHGELKRVVNSFLQLLDNFSAPSLVIAATNHEGLLDQALWRRFDEIVYFPKPSIKETRLLLEMKLKNFPYAGMDLALIAPRLHGMSHADIERICLDSVKVSVLDDRDSIDARTFWAATRRQQERIQMGQRALTKRSAKS